MLPLLQISPLAARLTHHCTCTLFFETQRQEVCRQSDIYSSSGGRCGSGCFWRPDIEDNGMFCAIPGQTVEDIADVWTSRKCDCSCDDMLNVKKPSVVVMTLSFVAKALVVTIVGVNMAFRLQ
jgi:hypothetical protein